MNPYKILNLDRNCTKKDIKLAYRKLALKYHPDKATGDKKIAEEKFKEISEAYQILIDDNRRNQYDLTGNMDDIFLDANELFETFFSEFDPELKLFVMSTYKNFNEAMDKTNDKSFLKVISNMNTSNLIKDSSRLITEYFLAKSENNEKNQNIKTDDSGYNDIILDEKQLTKFNNIQLSIDDYFIKNTYSIKITDGNFFTNYKLSTEYKEHKIQYKDKLYNISFVDKVHPVLKRVNGYDLLANIPIGIEDYREGFLFILNFANINQSLKIDKTMIFKFKNKGFPIWSKNIHGDLYVNFYLMFDKPRYYPEILSNFTKKNAGFDVILDNLNIYD